MNESAKRWIILLLIIISSSALMSVSAKVLNIDSFFKEDFAKNASVTMVSVSGNQSDWKGLTSYRSVSVKDDDSKADAMARAVGKDGAKADFKETSFKGGRLYFGFYGLGGEGRHRKYLFFLDLRPKGTSKTTLVYIEGDWTPDEVKQMITKKIK